MLGVTIQDSGKTAIIRCPRRIVAGQDIHTLRRTVVSQRKRETLVLDLAGVDAVDCSGLGLLVFLRRWAQVGGIEFFLASPRGYVRHLLELMGLDSVFEIVSHVRQMAA